jgi:hypothetical protein
LLLNNEKGSDASLVPGGRQSSPQRAVMVGQIWSAQLVETLLEMYSLDELFWFAREASEHRMLSDDRSGD